MREMKMVAASVSLSHPESVPKTLPSPGSESILASLLRFLLENDISESNQGWDKRGCSIALWSGGDVQVAKATSFRVHSFAFCFIQVMCWPIVQCDRIILWMNCCSWSGGTMSTESEALISVDPQITPRLALLPWEASQLTSSICLYICVCASASLCRLLLA